VLLPDGLSYEAAAPLLCAGYTAWSALRAAEPRPRERIAVLGIGGLGHLALQLARASGHETVAITHTPDKRDAIRKLGVEHIVADGAELRAAGGADIILATGTSYETAAGTIQGLRPEGRIVLASLNPTGQFHLGPRSPLWFQRQRILGATHGGLNLLAEVLELAASGVVNPMIEVYDKKQVAEAVAHADRNEVRFRAVIAY
jgi:alcohol dehydrogenase/propanol-preferring alcohol dehydrogenase